MELNLPRPHDALFLRLGVKFAELYLSCFGTDALQWVVDIYGQYSTVKELLVVFRHLHVFDGGVHVSRRCSRVFEGDFVVCRTQLPCICWFLSRNTRMGFPCPVPLRQFPQFPSSLHPILDMYRHSFSYRLRDGSLQSLPGTVARNETTYVLGEASSPPPLSWLMTRR